MSAPSPSIDPPDGGPSAAAGAGTASGDEWQVVGRLRGAFGVQGAMRVEPLSGDPQDSVLRHCRTWRLRDRAGQCSTLSVRKASVQGDHLLVWAQQPMTREEIEALRGQEVLVPRSAFPTLPDDEYYWADLMGCTVVNLQGEALGTVEAVDHHGAHALLQLTGGRLIPFVGQYILEVDCSARSIRVDWASDWD